MSWTIPIYDRTEADTAYAKQRPETTEDLKGAFNVGDYYRIENNLAYIAVTIMPRLGYFPAYTGLPDITEDAFPLLDSFNIIEADLAAIEACGVFLPTGWRASKTWVLGGAKPDYEDANRWELNPFLMYEKCQTVKKTWTGYNYGGSGNINLLRGYNL